MTQTAVQLYSLRDAGDLDTQLALVRAAGFDWVESVATHGRAAPDFAARLAAHGLRVASMHASLAPRIAWIRLIPPSAEHPVPGSRLLLAEGVS